MNFEQKKRFDKVFNEEFYLLNYENNKFNISGSTKNVYTVNFFTCTDQNNVKKYGSFYCNCPDMKNHARKNNVYCKHVCFIYRKICKFNRNEFYNSRWLTNEEEYELINKLTQLNNGLNDPTIQNKALIDKFNNLNLNLNSSNNKIDNSFTINILNKDFTDSDCPICFDNFNNSDNLFCQTCGNIVHKKCIKKWLERQSDCIYCRSECWENYGKTNLICSKYIQL